MPRDNEDARRHVQVLPERIGAVSPPVLLRLPYVDEANDKVAGSEFPGHYPGEDHSWNLERFKEVSQYRHDVIYVWAGADEFGRT